MGRLNLPPGDYVDLLVSTMQELEDLVLFRERWMARATAALRALSRFYGPAFQNPVMAARWEMAHARAEKAIHAEFRASGDQARGRHVVAVGRALGDRELAAVLDTGEGRFDAAERLWIAQALTFALAVREGHLAFFLAPDGPRVRAWGRTLDQIRVAGSSAISSEIDALDQVAQTAASAAVAFELAEHARKAA